MAYMSPEMHRRAPFCMKEADLFALGVSLFILAFGCFPFDRASKEDRVYRVLFAGNAQTFFKAHPKTRTLSQENRPSEGLCDLIVSMISPFRKERRSTVEQVRSHDWVQGP